MAEPTLQKENNVLWRENQELRAQIDTLEQALINAKSQVKEYKMRLEREGIKLV